MTETGMKTTGEVIEDRIELPRRVVHQPTPELNPGGDCGACVLAGLCDCSIEEVYAQLHPSRKVAPFNTRHEMYDALREAHYTYRRIGHFIARSPRWSVDDDLAAWGDTAWTQSLEWQDYLRLAFAGGYYALAKTVIKPSDGPLPKAGGTNHWNLLCGRSGARDLRADRLEHASPRHHTARRHSRSCWC